MCFRIVSTNSSGKCSCVCRSSVISSPTPIRSDRSDKSSTESHSQVQAMALHRVSRECNRSRTQSGHHGQSSDKFPCVRQEMVPSSEESTVIVSAYQRHHSNSTELGKPFSMNGIQGTRKQFAWILLDQNQQSSSRHQSQFWLTRRCGLRFHLAADH